MNDKVFIQKMKKIRDPYTNNKNIQSGYRN